MDSCIILLVVTPTPSLTLVRSLRLQLSNLNTHHLETINRLLNKCPDFQPEPSDLCLVDLHTLMIRGHVGFLAGRKLAVLSGSSVAALTILPCIVPIRKGSVAIVSMDPKDQVWVKVMNPWSLQNKNKKTLNPNGLSEALMFSRISW